VSFSSFSASVSKLSTTAAGTGCMMPLMLERYLAAIVRNRRKSHLQIKWTFILVDELISFQ
jgi:hypothetical protein